MKKVSLLFFGLFLYLSGTTQFHIQGCIRNMSYTKVYLAEILGDETRYIDSASVATGCFSLQLKVNQSTSLFSLVLNKKNNAYIRLIYNKENIEFSADLQHLLSTITFTSSTENTAYYNYTRKMDTLSKKTESLNKLQQLYDPYDPYSQSIQAELKKLNHSMRIVSLDVANKRKGTFFSKFLIAQQPVTIPELPQELKDEYLRTHYLDNFDLTYDPLTHTDLLPQAIRNYLALYEKRSYSYDQQEKKYELAVYNLLSIKGMSAVISGFITKELLNYFQFGNYDILGAFINDTYIQKNLCHDDQQLANLTKQTENIRRVAVGQMSPEIMLQGQKYANLSQVPNPYTLIVFWATTCPHCTQMLPELKNIYLHQKGNALELIAISIDNSKSTLDAFLEKGNYPWINYSDYKGWSGPIASAFNIRGTPTFYLLDQSKKIIAKPFDVDEVKLKLQAIGVVD